MKMTYMKPTIEVQLFTPNEYVATCVLSGKIALTCAIPGNSAFGVDDGTTARNDSYNMAHGICGNESSSISVNGGQAYEVENGQIAYNRPIANINIGSQNTTGTYSTTIGTAPETITNGSYNGTWISTDNNWTSTYHHYGRIKTTNVTTNNHS